MASLIESAAAKAAQISGSSTDPYGKNATGSTGSSASFRQRGDSTQKRVNVDTRVRSDANSGTAGANGSDSATGMGQALNIETAPAAGQQTSDTASTAPQNAAWQSTRQAVDLTTVRSRVLQSLTKK